MQNMTNSVINEFSKRMNIVADMLKIPPLGKNRQSVLGKMFGVSQEAARKWISGESMPQLSKCIEIAQKANVSVEWLLTGKGEQRVPVTYSANTPEQKVLALMQYMDEATKYQAVKIIDAIAEPKKVDGTNGQQ